MADGETFHALDIKVQTPGDPAEIQTRIDLNERRDLMDFNQRRTCVIVSSGPSAKDPAVWNEISRIIQARDHPVIAVNGALKLFTDRGLAPDYWACCDPQVEEVMRFVEGPLPTTTTYLLATKSPPELFEKLADRHVMRWRIDDYPYPKSRWAVPSAVSITLVTQNLFRFQGYAHFEHYGWDCCYLDGEHHASDQPEGDSERTTFEVRNGTPEEPGELVGSFIVNRSWVAELHDAVIHAHNFAAMGHTMRIHGPGAVATFLRVRGFNE